MIQTYEKRMIALTQAERALRLYFEERDYISVITLAGAAEEIFGKLLSAAGGENSLQQLERAVDQMYRHLVREPIKSSDVARRANRARNHLKHHDPASPSTVTLDAKTEAEDLLERTIANYWMLETTLTPLMRRFQDEVLLSQTIDEDV